MSKTITLPDKVHDSLERKAKENGFAGVAEYIQSWSLDDEEVKRRKDFYERLAALQKQAYEKHGVMPDSVPLIREDRER